MEWTSSLEFEAIIDAQRRPLSPEARMIFKIVVLIPIQQGAGRQDNWIS
jgi:hypothetical protein